MSFSDESSRHAESTVTDRALTPEELDDLIERDETPVSVTYSTQDFDVSGLVRRLTSEAMLVPQLGSIDDRVDTAQFQRGFVWTKKQMDRFVESLLLGYPVPGIFLVKQSSDNRLLVLDGQQRLETLRRFYDGVHGRRVFALENVGAQFRGLTYQTLSEGQKFQLDDSYMQATIVAADGSSEVDNAIYQIFERLNSGGTQLTPHEIRVALYAGPLIDLLESLNNNEHWRALYGPRSPRIRDQELILRALALYLNAADYSRPLKTFLNSFASDYRQSGAVVDSAAEVFTAAVEVLDTQVGPSAFRRPESNQVNVAQAEAIIVGAMRALAEREVATDLPSRIQRLLSDDSFIGATTRATADNDSVSERLMLATQALQS